MASEVMTNEEFRAHIKRMVTWLEATEQLKEYCPCCGKLLSEPLAGDIMDRVLPENGWEL